MTPSSNLAKPAGRAVAFRFPGSAFTFPLYDIPHLFVSHAGSLKHHMFTKKAEQNIARTPSPSTRCTAGCSGTRSDGRKRGYQTARSRGAGVGGRCFRVGEANELAAPISEADRETATGATFGGNRSQARERREGAAARAGYGVERRRLSVGE